MIEFTEWEKQMTLLDCLSIGIPWPESRIMAYRLAPNRLKMILNETGAFYDLEPFSDMEKKSQKNMPTLDSVFQDTNSYVFNKKSGVRHGDARLNWYAECKQSGKSIVFTLADLREHKIKIFFQRQFWNPHNRGDLDIDQIAEISRYFSRVLYTFRRMNHIRWIKIMVFQGRITIYVYNDDSVPPEPNEQLILDRSFYSDSKTISCELLDSALWMNAAPHVRDRIDFWRLEESGGLTDQVLDRAVRSEDEILAGWAVAYLRTANESVFIDQIRKQIGGNSLEEARFAVRTAGRLWLNDLESDVMSSYNSRGNNLGPAVADYIGSIGIVGRPFLPKILNTLARKGDFATMLAVIRALGSFPRSGEAEHLPEFLSIMLGLCENLSPVIERFPGVENDLTNPVQPSKPLHKFALETLRAAAVHSIIKTAAQTATDETFSKIVGQIHIDSPYFENLLEEIEDNIRTDVTEQLVQMLDHIANPEWKHEIDIPVSRRIILVVRTVMRINKAPERAARLMAIIPHISYHVGTYKRDSKISYNFHVDNYPDRPFIDLKSILKGLPDKDSIIETLQNNKNFSDRDRYIIRKLSS